MPVTINGSGGITSNDGSAAAPPIAGTDTNTGIFFPAADTIAFAEGGAEVMRIDSNGNVGIGTSSPNARLDAYAAANFVGVRASSGSNALTLYANSSGTQAGLYTDNANPILFWNSGTERARIDSSGNLLVGKTGATINSAGQELGSYAGFTRTGDVPVFVQRLTNTGDLIQFRYNASAVVGSISTNGTGVTYGTSSDYRLKENIAPMTGALARVAALKPCTYTWKSDGSAGEGFIAHELQQVCPDAVSGEKDAVNEDGSIKPQSIDTSFLVATLTAAIQEQQALIESLTARIAALEAA